MSRQIHKRMQNLEGDGASAEQEGGQALLEFALVAVFLLIVLFGIMDFARVFFAYATMSQGAREGARYGIVHPGQDGAIEQHAREMLVLIGGTADVQVVYPDGCMDRLCPVQVQITSDLPVWTPLIPAIAVEAQATMHIERGP